MKAAIAFLVIALFSVPTTYAGIARGGGGSRVNVQNHSSSANRSANVNQNANVNRNVNVNQNVDVNRNVNVHGGGTYYGGRYYGGPVVYENNNNFGAFAAGAAVGVATTAAVAAATRPSTTVVATPGAVVTALPGSCASISGEGGVVYNCNSVYYRPYYQGTTLVYQVVTYP
jgi:hypothetical protein